MDDSSMFIQWAMATLQQEHPAAALGGGDAFPSSLPNGTRPAAAEAAAQDVHRQQAATDSWSSGDSGRENTPGGWSSNCSVGSTTYPPASWNLAPSTVAMAAQPSIDDENATPTAARARAARDVPEPARRSSPASRKRSSERSAASTGTGAGAGHTSSPEPQEHVMAERKRREKINRRFIELSTVIPGLKKMDKATILSDAVRFIREQQERLKELEEGRDTDRRSAHAVVDPVVLVKRPCSFAGKPDGGCAATRATAGSSLPEIEARIWERDVMVRILCEDGKGVLVRVLAEIEGLHLRIAHTNVSPCFPAGTVSVTIMAKAEEGLSIAAEDIVGKLDATLRRPT